MPTYEWSLQETDDKGGSIISGGAIVQFAGGAFDGAVTVGAFQDSTHNEYPSSVDVSAGVGRNNKWRGGALVSLDGGGDVALNTITSGQCTLRYIFTHGCAVAITSHIFYAYDGTTPATGPGGDDAMECFAFEFGDTNWTLTSGNNFTVSITDSGSDTQHNFSVGVSCSPKTVGTKTNFALRSELTYT